ncbi:hypothetical protein, partial [Streptococcus pneumoniae]|uniref:hypothetical protein n=1 Tax=Streptococcus pneumoniae TaxID=1313 RepID=UPI001E2E9CE7
MEQHPTTKRTDLGITNSGNEFKVFATIVAFLKHAIEKYNVKIFTFSAENNEPSRVSLYRKLAQRFSTQGW